MKGFTLIELMIVVAIIAIIAAIAIPNLLESKKAANEAAAVSALRTISSAEELYNNRFGEYGELSEMTGEGFIDSVLGSADIDDNPNSSKQGFKYDLTVSSSGAQWSCVAFPSDWGVTGERAFYIDQTGVIYKKTGAGGSWEAMR